MSNYYSKIFWHFTGSPQNIDWNLLTSPEDILRLGNPKSIEQSWDILIKIFTSKSLNATCIEKLFCFKKTEKFCCVTDIPLIYLERHKKYYGDIAIGFRSKRIYEEFNPVLYIARDKLGDAALYRKEEDDVWTLEQLEKEGISAETAERSGFKIRSDGGFDVPTVKLYYDANNTKLERFFLNHVKGTIFSDSAGKSFYQEREWRKIGDFDFNFEDIAAIIIPETHSDIAIKELNKFNLKNLSILTWEVIEKA